MMKREDMSRKAFIKKASTGFLALGMSTWNTSSRHEPLDHSDPDDPLVVLGGTNIRVTRMAYGASRTMNPNLLRYALEKLNFLDTGRSYANGQNEVMVGKAIQPVRDKMVIQSKVRVRLGRTESGGETGIGERIRKDMERSLEESLKALLKVVVQIIILKVPIWKILELNKFSLIFTSHQLRTLSQINKAKTWIFFREKNKDFVHPLKPLSGGVHVI